MPMQIGMSAAGGRGPGPLRSMWGGLLFRMVFPYQPVEGAAIFVAEEAGLPRVARLNAPAPGPNPHTPDRSFHTRRVRRLLARGLGDAVRGLFFLPNEQGKRQGASGQGDLTFRT
jgi:hypothetical protein